MQQLRDMNEALLLSSIRQQELTEKAERAEAALRASEAQLLLTLAYADNIIATIREPLLVLDQDLRVVTANRSFYQDFHATPDATQGQLVYDLGNRQWDIPRLRTLLEDVLPQNHAFDDFEVARDFPDIGRRVMLLNARRILKPGNQSELILLAIEDITGRRRVEAALRESDELNRSIIDSSPDCIKILDLDGNLQSLVCGFDLLGIDDIGPYLNTSWVDFWHGDDRRAARAAVETAREKAGAVGNFVGFFRTHRDEPKWWDVTLSPILDGAGRPKQLLAVSRDVTDRKRTEMNLAFFASVNRDLARFTDGDDMIRTVGAKIGAYLGLSLCVFYEVDEAADEAVVTHDWHRDDVPGLVGVYRLADFVTEAFLRDARAGETIVVRDTAADPRTTPENFAALKIASFLCAPLLRDGRWRYALSLNRSEASDWREDEIEIARELTARVWTRLERLRADDALRASQSRLRHAANAAGLTYVEVDLASGGARTAENYAAVMGYAPPPEQKTDVTVGTRLLLDHVVPHDRPSVEAALRDFTGGHDVGKIEYRVLGDDRIERYIESEWFIEFDPNGEPLKTFATNLDITERKRAGVLLQQNHDTFYNLIENSPFGLYIVDARLRVIKVSAVARNVFRNIHPLIGRDFEEIMTILWPEDFARFAVGRFRHTLDTGEPFAMPNFVEQRRDEIDIESYDWKIERITLPDGQFGVVCYFYDITERKQGELALRASEEQYRTLFDSIDEGYCILEMIFDENEKPVDWRFLEVNPSFEKQTGMRDIVGKRVRSLIPNHEAYWFETYGAVVRTGEPIRFVNQAKGLDNQWFDLYAFRVGGADSRKVAVLFNNISERKRFEEAIRQSERSLKFILASMPQMITTAKPTGEIDSYNPQWLEYTGLTLEQMRGWGWKDIIHPDDLDETVRLWARAVATGETYHRQERFRRADGEYRWHLSRAVPMKDADGRVVMWIGSNTDVHDIKEIENQLQEQTAALADLHRRKDEFLAMLSHELRSPLAPISNAVHLLRMQAHEEPHQRQARSVIERQVGQLSRLVDDLMEVSRITTGRVHLRQERVVVGGIVERAVETAYPMMEHRQHKLTVTVPPEPIWLFADSGRLEQVVVNLLTNAAKYTEVGGQVWVTVELADSLGQCELRVRDTGVGIAPGLVPRVFDLFTQAERSLDRSQGGLGIGLALVQRLVEMHGGTVEVTSVLGQGSEFTVRLPLLKEDGKMRKFEVEPAGTTAAAGSPLKVLVVDDNEDSAESLAMLLQVCGHDVRLAHDGLRALEEATDYRPDVVLLDIGLPKMDGYEVAAKLRQQPEYLTCVLVALTGYGQESDRQRSLDAGFDHHLVKPADFAKLQQILAEASQRK